MRCAYPDRMEPDPACVVVLPTPLSIRATRRQETLVLSTYMLYLSRCGHLDPRYVPCCSMYTCTTEIALERPSRAQEPRQGQDDSRHVQRSAEILGAVSMRK